MTLSWYFYALNNLLYHIVGRGAFHFLFGSECNTVTQYRRYNVYNIIGCYKITAPHRGQRFGPVQDTNRCPRRGAQVNGFMIAGVGYDGRYKTDQFFFYM